MDRRTALSIVGVLVLGTLAGCSAAGSLELHDASTDAALADRASRPTTLPAEGPTHGRELVRSAIENGSATARSRRPLVEPGLPFARAGRYYNVSWTVEARHPGTAVDVAIDYNGTADPGGTVAYEDLSARDKVAIDRLLPPRTDHRRSGYEFGTGITYNATERNRSVLIAESAAAVRFDGETYPVRVGDPEPVTIRTYRYTASVVANTTAAYANHLRERYLFALSNLSEAEREVVETAIEDTYYAEDTDDRAFESVMDRLQEHDAIRREDYRGTWLVRFDGAVYLADLSYGGFDEGDRS